MSAAACSDHASATRPKKRSRSCRTVSSPRLALEARARRHRRGTAPAPVDELARPHCLERSHCRRACRSQRAWPPSGSKPGRRVSAPLEPGRVSSKSADTSRLWPPSAPAGVARVASFRGSAPARGDQLRCASASRPARAVGVEVALRHCGGLLHMTSVARLGGGPRGVQHLLRVQDSTWLWACGVQHGRLLARSRLCCVCATGCRGPSGDPQVDHALTTSAPSTALFRGRAMRSRPEDIWRLTCWGEGEISSEDSAALLRRLARTIPPKTRAKLIVNAVPIHARMGEIPGECL